MSYKACRHYDQLRILWRLSFETRISFKRRIAQIYINMRKSWLTLVLSLVSLHVKLSAHEKRSEDSSFVERLSRYLLWINAQLNRV
jgi:hypothetical protein